MLLETILEGDLGAFEQALDEALADEPGTIDRKIGREGRTPLHWAAEHGQLEIAERLLARGADPLARDDGDRATPLHWAAHSGNRELVALLIDHGCDVDDTGDAHGWGPLGWATIDEPHPEVARQLLDSGARPDIFAAIALDDEGHLRRAVGESPDALGRTLSTYEHFRSPLHFAASLDHGQICETLIELGADAGVESWLGLTALAVALVEGGDDAAAVLRGTSAESGPSVDLALGRHGRALETLAEHPEWLARGGRYGRLLHYAAQEGLREWAVTLLDAGADPSARIEWWGNQVAPLHPATSFGHADLVRLLVERGAETAVRDDEYDGTPLGWAHHFEHSDIVAYLDSVQAEP